jgi:hypothetical protein
VEEETDEEYTSAARCTEEPLRSCVQQARLLGPLPVATDIAPSSRSRLPTEPSPTLPDRRSPEPASQLLARATERLTLQTASSLPSPTNSRPIYPNVPFSPYGSPCATRRHRPPARQSSKVERGGDEVLVQLNQYRLERSLGQGSYGIVKLAYNKEDDTHYVSSIDIYKNITFNGSDILTPTFLLFIMLLYNRFSKQSWYTYTTHVFFQQAMKILSKKKLMKKAGIYGAYIL